MPRQVNQKCLSCARLSREQAIDRYGNTCWDDRLCPARRSRYANREVINQKKSAVYKEKRIAAGAETEEVEVIAPKTKDLPFTVVQYYRENAQSPVHAVIVELWIDHKLRAQFPHHTFSLNARQLNAYLMQILKHINQKYQLNLQGYDSSVAFKPNRCPITPCPFEPKPVEDTLNASP